MSFLEKVKQLEAEKQRAKDDIQSRMPDWVRAVGQLCNVLAKLVQPEARRMGQSSPVLAQRGTCRLEGFQLATLEITYKAEEKSATVKPLPLTDPRVKEAMGCILFEGQGQVYQLLWDGKAQTVPGHWQIKDPDSDTKELTEATLDETLELLFGFIEKPPKPKPKRRLSFAD